MLTNMHLAMTYQRGLNAREFVPEHEHMKQCGVEDIFVLRIGWNIRC